MSSSVRPAKPHGPHSPRSPQFGAILFRAAALIGEQGGDAFEQLDVGISANKISIVLAIYTGGPMTSSELADHIGLSRQLIESRLKHCVADGFLITHPDSKDSRRRVYSFSEKAEPIADRVVEIMTDFEGVYDQLWQEISVDLEAAALAMERALGERSLINRLSDKYPQYKK